MPVNVYSQNILPLIKEEQPLDSILKYKTASGELKGIFSSVDENYLVSGFLKDEKTAQEQPISYHLNQELITMGTTEISIEGGRWQRKFQFIIENIKTSEGLETLCFF